MRKLHLTNAKKRNAPVAMGTVKAPPGARLGLPGGGWVQFRRYLAATSAGTDEALRKRYGGDYGDALAEGDPEIDVERVGRRVEGTQTVYLSSRGEVLHAPPRVVEVLTDPRGKEKERRDPEDVPQNVNDELPVRWTGRKLKKADAVRRFLFRRTLQLRHTDGLTYDFLFEMAKELSDEEAMVLLGAGKSGKEPLVFQLNGMPYRGFLEGRVDGERYMLLVHLSNMELKRPVGEEGDAA